MRPWASCRTRRELSNSLRELRRTQPTIVSGTAQTAEMGRQKGLVALVSFAPASLKFLSVSGGGVAAVEEPVEVDAIRAGVGKDLCLHRYQCDEGASWELAILSLIHI